jgi:hypothetical protein
VKKTCFGFRRVEFGVIPIAENSSERRASMREDDACLNDRYDLFLDLLRLLRLV